MNILKRIFYFGSDEEFIEKIKKFLVEKVEPPFELSSYSYVENMVINKCSELFPHLVFIDFTNDDTLKRSYLDEVIFLKKIPLFRPMVFVFVHADEIDELTAGLLFTSGFTFSYIKGSEEQKFFSDCCYVTFDQKYSFPQYATAKNLDLVAIVELPSTITHLSHDHLYIESDYLTDDELLHINFTLFEDAPLTSLKVVTRKSSSSSYPMLYSYQLEFPYAGPWDDVTTNSLQSETVETWIGNNQEQLQSFKCQMKIISHNVEMIHGLYSMNNSNGYLLDYSSEIDPNTFLEEASLTRPAIIFYDLDSDPKGKNNSDSLVVITNAIAEIDNYYPIIVVTNTPSRAEALQKIYSYNSIIASPSSLELKTVLELGSRYIKSHLSKHEDGPQEYFFTAEDKSRIVYLNCSVIITSINEHELTFISREELPCFTTIYMRLPVPFYATIVPSYYELRTSSKGTHYMAIIHGVSEDAISTIRKFVNQIIYNPINILTEENVSKILQPKKVKEMLTVEDEHIKVNIEEPTNAVRPEFQVMRKKPVSGKSKL